MTVYTIYVPPGWSVEQALEAIKRGDGLYAKFPWCLNPGYFAKVDENGKVVA